MVVAIAVAVEVARWRGEPGAGAAGQLVLGAHFDPWDLVAYAVGLAAAIGWDRRATGSYH